MQETPTRKPIGSINSAYIGCLLLVMACAAGITIGGMAVYILMH